MAMYEDRGYCPYNELIKYDINEKVSEKWKITKNLLGDRLGYMVYPNAGYSYKGAYVVDALKLTDSILGIQVASTIQSFIPRCEYAKIGLPIICTDVLNPYQIPVNIKENDKGEWFLDCKEDTTILYQDERYLVVVDKKEQEVYMYFYKK